MSLGEAPSLQNASPEAVAPNPREVVVLVHGMGRTKASMLLMARALEKAGYEAVNWGYDSRWKSVSEAGEALAGRITEVERDETVTTIHFVGHSLGGIVIRWLIANRRPDKLGRVVMLAPPNQGARRADPLAKWWSWLLRPLPELTTAEDSTARSIPALGDVEVGIIAGRRDTKVAIEETHLDGQADHVVVPSGHTMIMLRAEVQRLTVEFLKSGRFGAATPGPPPPAERVR